MGFGIGNSGNAVLTLSGTGLGITITGANASFFSQTSTCGTSLAAGASCEVYVTFKPLAAGTLTATVNIADSAYGSPQKVSLSGTGTGPSVTLSHTALTFPSTTVGTAAAVEGVTLYNVGNAALSLSGTGDGVTITGANSSSYSQTSNCGASVAAGGSCLIRVTFKPTAKGALAASLNIADSAYGSPQKVALTGTGK
jgi:hypothetical protein